MLWHCPLCKSKFSLVDKTLRCDNGHSFDQARQGYFNFHLVNKKKTLKPGDSKDMILARRDFLNLGHYAPLAKLLQNVLSTHLEKTSEAKLLDLGCGEAYYLSELRNAGGLSDSISIYGIDISKDAIIHACKRKISKTQFAVASTFDIPAIAETIDAAVNVFAPFDETEVVRVLKSEGVFVRASPGPRHLIELKTVIYQTPEFHSHPTDLVELQKTGEKTITNRIRLTSMDALEQLKKMTPYAWKGDQELLAKWAKTELKDRGHIEMTTDFIVDIWQKI